MSDFAKYFSDIVEYPSPCEDVLPLGTRYDYISTTFLNGWINYVDVVAARLVTRYTDHGLNVADAGKFNARVGGGMSAHTTDFQGDGHLLQDDVLVLARPQIQTKMERWTRPLGYLCPKCLENPCECCTPDTHWWFFWFDCDCSDSCIGRFSTLDAGTTVIQRFSDYCDGVNEEHGHEERALVLDPAAFTGWISA